MRFKALFALYIGLLLSQIGRTQNVEDSILNVIQHAPSDTARINEYNYLATYLLDHNEFIKSKFYAKSALGLSEEIDNTSKIIESKFNVGAALYYSNDYEASQETLQEVVELCKKNNRYVLLAKTLDLLGNNQMDMGSYGDATQSYFEALKYYEHNNDDEGIIKVWNNLGRINMRQSKLKEAAEYFIKCIERSIKLNIPDHLPSAYNNIAIVYYQLGKKDEAFNFLDKALVIYDQTDDRRGKAACLGNIGNFYFYEGDMDKVLEYYFLSLKEYQDVNDTRGICFTLNNIGFFYAEENRFEEGISHIEEALEIALRIDSKPDVVNSYEYLSHVYEKQGNDSKALENYKLYAAYHDSVINNENLDKLAELETSYEFSQKEREIKLLKKKQEVERTQKEAENRQNLIVQTSLFIGLLMILLIAGNIYRNNMIRKKQNEEISYQKMLLEAKNKDIMDSINYAKTIQDGILPSPEMFSSSFDDYFVYYQPKDVVSGDFYWIEKRDNLVFFSVADCTGHGVPGAMVSVLGSNALYRSVNEFNLEKPSDILDKISEILISGFKKSGRDIKDGMDLALCCLDLTNLKLHYAGAHNPLYIVRHDNPVVIEETKANKQPVGQFSKSQAFTNHTIQLHKQDFIYLFSDGFSDQFGGEKGKKYKYKKFKSLLLSILSDPMAEQKNKLEREFNDWKGDLDQIDDVCVLGIRV